MRIDTLMDVIRKGLGTGYQHLHFYINYTYTVERMQQTLIPIHFLLQGTTGKVQHGGQVDDRSTFM